MEVTGILKVKFDTQVVSDKFSKREFVLTIEPESQYPQHISMQVTQDKCWLLDAINIGDEIKAHFNLRGREWNGRQGVKYFNTIDVWKLDRIKWSNPAPNNSATVQAASQDVNNSVNNSTGSNDDLPF